MHTGQLVYQMKSSKFPTVTYLARSKSPIFLLQSIYKVEAIQIFYVVGIKNHKNPSQKSMTCCEIYWLFFPKSKHYQKYGIRLVGCLPTDQSRSLFLVMFTFRKVVISWRGGTFRFIENQVENWSYLRSLWFY